jgi:serine/threonine-protein kinase
VESFNDLMFKIALEDPPPPRTHVPDLDPNFEAIIMKAMARDAAKRFASVEELSNVLEDWANERSVPLSNPPQRISRPSVPDIGSSSPRSFPAVDSEPRVAKAGLAATIPNETPPAIESSPILTDDLVPGMGTPKRTKIIMGALAAAALVGLILIVSVLASSSSGTPASAAGLVTPSASASAPIQPPTTTEPVAIPPPPAPETSAKTTTTATASAAARPITRPTGVGPTGVATTKPAGSAKPNKPNKPSGTDFGY